MLEGELKHLSFTQLHALSCLASGLRHMSLEGIQQYYSLIIAISHLSP